VGSAITPGFKVSEAVLLTNEITPAKPIVKWPGGKGKLLKHLLPLVPEFTGMYHEPFMGGGALFFALASVGRISLAHLGDVSPLLVRTYQAVAKDPEGVIRYLSGQTNTEEAYYAARVRLNKMLDNLDVEDPAEVAALTVYLNKTCFNGLFRVNGKGKFNASWGKYKDPKFCVPENLRAASRAFGMATIRLESFEGVCRRAIPGDFVYFDPPYVPRNTSEDFTEYTSEGFKLHDHQTLSQIFMSLALKGVKAMASNSDVPLVRELYRSFRITEIQANRVINSKASNRGKVPEVIICNW
jgi:DNA adenine methylase